MSWAKPKLRKTGDFTTGVQMFRLSAASVVIGAACAMIAILLLKMIGILTNVSFYHRLSFSFSSPTHHHLGAGVILVPILGALIIGFIARFGSEKIRGHGIPEAIEAMLIHQSKIQPRVAFWKPISAAISIGTGGPFGAEGPIIMTGGSFGSLFSQCFHFSSVERRILLVAGAAGGMSATFASPVSAVLFAIELLIFEFKPRSLVPIAVASAVADIIRISLVGPGPLFGMPTLQHVTWTLSGVAVGIGIVGSFLAVLLTWAIYGVEDLFRRLPIHWMWWPAIGAVLVGVGGWIAPRALGTGYDSISAMLNLKLTTSVLLGLLVVKTVVWVVALGSNTSGGILAPILIIGGSLGGVAGEMFHAAHPEMWALLGMSAIFAGVTRTPFTSVIFPLELTHNLGALLPLLITSSIACGLSSFILPRSILTEKIDRRGLHLTREYSVDPLQMHYVRELTVPARHSVPEDATIRDVAHEFVQGRIDEAWVNIETCLGQWIGIVPMLDVFRHLNDSPNAAIQSLIKKAPVVSETDTAIAALHEMLKVNTSWVGVVSKEGALLGALTIERLLEIRHQSLVSESQRGRVFQFAVRFRKKQPIVGRPISK